VAIQPGGHGYTPVAKTLLDGLRKITQSAAVAPLCKIDGVLGPDVKHISVVVKQLLYVILKGDDLALMFELDINLLVRDVSVQAIRAVSEVLLRG
jgi:hypothetical protein